jgi:hypothetical protein
MLDLNQVQADIERWIENFVEVPNPALGGWPPCPYARKARLERDFDVRIGTEIVLDLTRVSQIGIDKSVVIFVYERNKYAHKDFAHLLEVLNTDYLVPKDLLALEDHPDDPEIINGVCMNQGTYTLALVQSLSDLDAKARLMAKNGFYDTWPEDYLKILFSHRQDPRS